MSEAERADRERAGGAKWKAWCVSTVLLALIFAVLAMGAAPFVSVPTSGQGLRAGSALEEWWNGNKGFLWGGAGGEDGAPCPCPHLENLTGIVTDCCCEYETVYALNHEVLHSLLGEIVRQPFFRYFKVKLWCDCPFWPEDGMCRLRDCSVCECPDGEFPESHKGGNGHGQGHGLGLEDISCQEGKPEAAVDRTLDARAFRGWTESDNPWTHEDELDNEDMTYVNLLLNQERFTGYVGPSARRIWEAIYGQNCFRDEERDSCAEARVLYRLISGLHASISTHIAADYLLDEAAGIWGPNPSLLYERVLARPERVQNLYFTFLFVLRAVTKAADYLAQAEYSTGNAVEDRQTLALVERLVHNERLRSACPVPFDEAQMWGREDGAQLMHQIQHHFRNISALMDCVGCEKCRLWGKLQTAGLATALKILFSTGSDSPSGNGNHTLDLQQNEVIALVNLLHRLSESLEAVHDMAPTAAKEAHAANRR